MSGPPSLSLSLPLLGNFNDAWFSALATKRRRGIKEEEKRRERKHERRRRAKRLGPARYLFSLSLSPPLSRLLPSLFFFFFLFLLSSLLSFLSLFLGKKKVSLSQPVRDAMREPDIRAKVILPPSSPTLLRSFKQLCKTTMITNQLSNRILRFLFFLLSEQIIFLIILLRQTRSKLTSRFCISLPQYLNSLT